MPTLRNDRVRERAMEIGLYLPLGAYARVRDELADLNVARLQRVFGDLIERGQGRAQPVERMLRRGRRAVEEEVDRTRKDVRQTTRTTQRRTTAAANTMAPKLPRVATPKSADELPIEGYDSLTASEIVSAVRGLTQTDLAKVYKYERANDNRATVLEAIEARFVQLPIPTYDALSATEILERLESLSKDELKTLRRYELDTKDRKTIVEKIDFLL